MSTYHQKPCPGKYCLELYLIFSTLDTLISYFSIKNFSKEITLKYFEQLPIEDIIKLYIVYEDDFKLFDYHFNVNEYIDC